MDINASQYLTHQSTSNSPIKRPMTVAKKSILNRSSAINTSNGSVTPSMLPELNASFHFKNSIGLFQEFSKQLAGNNISGGSSVSPAKKKGKKINSSVVIRQINKGNTSINTTTIYGSKNSPMIMRKSPYHTKNNYSNGGTLNISISNSASPQKQRRLLSDYPYSSKTANKPLKIRCSSLLQITPCSSEPTLTPEQISELYHAKCVDLKLQYLENQEDRFHDFCNKYCVDGKIIFRDVFFIFPYIILSWEFH